MDLEKYINTYYDFPEKGIEFKDISPLLANGETLHYVVEKMSSLAKGADIILGPDARGFLFGTPVAFNLRKPFVMVRKPHKLPGKVVDIEFDYEYGKNKHLEMQDNLIKKGDKVAIIDDVLATGGTMEAIVKLVEKQGGKVIKIIFLMELLKFDARKKFGDIETSSLIKI
ncbi:MAG: adenine phosphoribosyltransferase [Metamycoplasmataceae bacterium]